jgi:hypothetical protein
VPKPSVPQFTVKFIDDSYTVLPTKTFDPYTGATSTQPGYTVTEVRIEVTINNLPAGSYKTSEGYECNLYYRVGIKGRFAEDWGNFAIMYYGVADDYSAPFVESSNGKHTIVSYSYSGSSAFPPGAQLDFRVQALYAYEDPSTISHMAFIHEALLVEAISGDWSDIKTITINYKTLPSSSSLQTATASIMPTSDPNNTPSPQQSPWQSYLIGILAAICIITIPLAIIPHINKQRKNNTNQTQHTTTT